MAAASRLLGLLPDTRSCLSSHGHPQKLQWVAMTSMLLPQHNGSMLHAVLGGPHLEAAVCGSNQQAPTIRRPAQLAHGLGSCSSRACVKSAATDVDSEDGQGSTVGSWPPSHLQAVSGVQAQQELSHWAKLMQREQGQRSMLTCSKGSASQETRVHCAHSEIWPGAWCSWLTDPAPTDCRDGMQVQPSSPATRQRVSGGMSPTQATGCEACNRQGWSRAQAGSWTEPGLEAGPGRFAVFLSGSLAPFSQCKVVAGHDAVGYRLAA